MQPQPASSLSVRTSCSYRGDEETGWERESERGIKMADDIIYNNNNRQLTNIEFAACTMTSIEESSFCPVLFDLQLTEYRGRRAFWVGWVTSQILRVHRPKHPKKYVHQVLQRLFCILTYLTVVDGAGTTMIFPHPLGSRKLTYWPSASQIIS